MTSIATPKLVQDASSIPKWRAVVMEEIKTLEKNRTWECMSISKGKKIVECK